MSAQLTDHELRVLATTFTFSAKEAAWRLGISENTVKNILSDAVYPKLGVCSMRAAAAALGWVTIPSGYVAEPNRTFLPVAAGSYHS
jgi:DNA-binding XRE family transcriptional regulator